MHAFAQLCIAAAGVASFASAISPPRAKRACQLEREELETLGPHPEALYYAGRALTELRSISIMSVIGKLGAPGSALCVGLCYLSPSAQQAWHGSAIVSQFLGCALAVGGAIFFAQGRISLSPGQICSKYPPRRGVSGEVEQAFAQAHSRLLSENERAQLTLIAKPLAQQKTAELTNRPRSRL